MREDDARRLDYKTLEALGTGRSLRPVWRATDGCSAVAGHNQSYDVWVAGELSPGWLGRPQGETSFWSSTKAGRQETEMDLRNGNAEESAAAQIFGSSGNRVGDFGGFRWAGACRRGLLGGDIPRLSGRMRVAETLGSCC